jgi:hypothetical protein
VYKVPKWVKRLEDGWVVMYTEEQGPENDPYVIDLSAPYDCDVDHPAEPLTPWFRRTMCAEASKYTILRNEVVALYNWGHLAEVERYRSLSQQMATLSDRIENLSQDLESLRLLCDLSESRLSLACTQAKVGHLEGRYHLYPVSRPLGWKRGKKVGLKEPSLLREQED